ncbi:MAG: hypothetical protein HYV07_21970 [Deltaproteobacteria bacterium]|nr:hypothetical protein [Deltaproteobacteria bacterium]
MSNERTKSRPGSGAKSNGSRPGSAAPANREGSSRASKPKVSKAAVRALAGTEPKPLARASKEDSSAGLLEALVRSRVSVLVQGPGPLEAVLSRLRRVLPDAAWADLRESPGGGRPGAKDLVVLLGSEVSSAQSAWLATALDEARVIAVSAAVLEESVRLRFGTVVAASAVVKPNKLGAAP